MSTTFYSGDNGKLSSIRSTIKVGKSRIIMTQYPGSGKGGVTFKGSHMTTRMNHKGQSIAFGINNGRKTTYLGKDGGVRTRITAFR